MTKEVSRGLMWKKGIKLWLRRVEYGYTISG